VTAHHCYPGFPDPGTLCPTSIKHASVEVRDAAACMATVPYSNSSHARTPCTLFASVRVLPVSASVKEEEIIAQRGKDSLGVVAGEVASLQAGMDSRLGLESEARVSG
jgi:hypothetical protein